MVHLIARKRNIRDCDHDCDFEPDCDPEYDRDSVEFGTDIDLDRDIPCDPKFDCDLDHAQEISPLLRRMAWFIG